MEALIWLVSLLVSVAQPSERRAAATQYWVDLDKKQVHFVPPSELKITWTDLKVSSDQWATVNVEFKPSSDMTKYQNQRDELQNQYPGFALVKAVSWKVEDLRLSIPLLKIDNLVKTSRSSDGPAFQEMYFISKSQSDEVKRAIQSETFASVQGTFTVMAPESKIVESVELPKTTCTNLFKPSNSVLDVVSNVGRLFSKLDETSFKYESTRETLKKSVVENCADFQFDFPVRSFAELIGLTVEQKNPVQPLKAEKRSSYQTEKTAVTEYYVVHNVGTTEVSNER
jgi:hypothetical protein